MLSEETMRQLDVPLNPNLISVLQAGPASGEPYLETFVVISEANAVFGVGGWGFVLDGPPFILAKGDDPSKPGKNDVWAAIGRVTLAGGESHGDMGTNTQSGPGPAAVEMAAKGSVSDCLKRCMTHLADRLGLVLRDKQTNRAEIERRWREYLAASGGEVPMREQPATLPQQEAAPAPPATAVEYPWVADFRDMMTRTGVAAAAVCAVVGVTPGAKFLTEVAPAIDWWLRSETGRTVEKLLSEAADRAANAQLAGSTR